MMKTSFAFATATAIGTAIVLCTMTSFVKAGDALPTPTQSLRSVLRRSPVARSPVVSTRRMPSGGELLEADITGIQLEAYPEIPTRPTGLDSRLVAPARKRHRNRTIATKPVKNPREAPIVLPEFGRSTLPWRGIRQLASTDTLRSQSRRPDTPRMPSANDWYFASSKNRIDTVPSSSKLVSIRKPASAARVQFHTDRPTSETASETARNEFAAAPPHSLQPSELSNRPLPLPVPLPLPQNAKVRGASKVVSMTPPSRPSVRVDTKELRQRITSHNRSLRALEDRLGERQNWDFHSLYSTTDEIETLLRSRDVWMLYWKSLDVRQKRRLTVASPDKALETLRQRIFEAQVEAEINQSAYNAKKQARLLKSLKQLDQRVMSLAS